MKILQILVLVILVCVFSLDIKAQADCRYGLKFFVGDETGKVIENAKLELVSLNSESILPSYVKLIRIDGAYLFTGDAGTTVNGDFLVNISTDDFETYQQKVNFPICKIQNFDIKLKSITNSSGQNLSILTGSVYDANGAVIVQAEVTAVNEKGENFKTETNSDGVYVLKLPFNLYNTKFDFRIANYEITVYKEGFEKNIIKNFKFIPSYKDIMNLDIALDVFVNINIIPVDSNKQKNILKRKNNK